MARCPCWSHANWSGSPAAGGRQCGTSAQPKVALTAGTRLIREWNGQTIAVEVRRRRVRLEGPNLALAQRDRPGGDRRPLVGSALLRA